MMPFYLPAETWRASENCSAHEPVETKADKLVFWTILSTAALKYELMQRENNYS